MQTEHEAVHDLRTQLAAADADKATAQTAAKQALIQLTVCLTFAEKSYSLTFSLQKEQNTSKRLQVCCYFNGIP